MFLVVVQVVISDLLVLDELPVAAREEWHFHGFYRPVGELSFLGVLIDLYAHLNGAVELFLLPSFVQGSKLGPD